MKENEQELLKRAEDTPCQFYYEIDALIERASSADVIERLRSIQLRKRMQERRSCYGSC